MPSTRPMTSLTAAALLLVCAVLLASPLAADKTVPPGKTTAEVLEGSKPTDWRPLDPESTLYLTLPEGRVVIELAPAFAPKHVENIRKLARQKYFDGLAVIRSQENYVVQWGDPNAEDKGKRRPFGEAKSSLPAEFDRSFRVEEGGALPFTALGDADAYAPVVGFTEGFPVARDPETGRTWLAHCYAMVGAGRAMTADSGSGAELYVVIGHAPRHLDRNVTLVGRVVKGMEVLTTLPRGTGALGFYEEPGEHVPVLSIRVGSDLPEAERVHLELLRTDTETFRALIDARRWRREEWFLDPVGHVGLCNVPLPVRRVPEPPSPGPDEDEPDGR